MNRIIKVFLIIVAVFILFLTSLEIARAAIVFTISNPVINSNDEVEVDASVTGLTSSSCSISGCYLQAQLRIVDESKNFFGLTFNNSEEYIDYFSSASSIDEIKSKLFNFIPVSGSWTGKLKAKNNSNDQNYIGPGQYNLKFRRFSGNSITPTSGDSNTITIAFSLATPSPSPTPSPTSVTTIAPTTAPITSPTKTPTPTPSKTPSPKPSITPSSSPSSSPEILGESVTSHSETPSPTPLIADSNQKKIPVIPIVLISSGLLMVAFAVLQLIRASRNSVQT